MSAERNPAETATPSVGGDETAELPPAVKLQILTAEHSSLAMTRSLAWNEAFSRTGMYLSILSGAMVALALVAQGSGPGRVAQQFALVILPIVLFVGIATFIRLGATNTNEAMCVIGLNRIRAAYLEIAPDLAKYFVMSAHDDPRGVGITMGVAAGPPSFGHFIAATPVVVATLNAIVVGVIFVLIGLQLGAEIGPSLIAGLVGFVLAAATEGRYASISIARGRAGVRPLFPHPTEVPPPAAAPARTSDPS
jgi:hypothetical protein